ncbi:MAG: RNA 2',3'-cyclic phosphodiesterase [Actinomycetota bacterium]|nr:RNA 2',3'-cyclic phosphodiesterase [Actinomycetota bacterium]
MSDERARLFVALQLPGSARDALSQWGALVLAARPGVRALSAVGLHATLCFLGARDIDELEEIAAACEGVAGAGAVALSLGPALGLPPRRPRVVAVTLQDPEGTLAAIQATLSAVLAAASVYEPERRPFLPHVTVARVRAGAERIRAAELPAPPALPFTASAVTLYRSRLGSAGARYEGLRTIPLAGFPAPGGRAPSCGP